MQKICKILMTSFVIMALIFIGGVSAEEIIYTEVNNASSLKEAIENGENVKLIADFELAEAIHMEKDDNITLDLNGHTITGKDKVTSGNYALFEMFKGTFTVVDSKGNGTITIEAEKDRGWTAFSAVINNRSGVLNIEGGTFKHLGGTTMAYAFDIDSNTFGTAVLNFNAGTVESSYIGVRLFMATVGPTYVNVKGGSITGKIRGIWAQAPEGNLGETAFIVIEGGYIDYLDTPYEEGATVVTTTVKGGKISKLYAEVGEVKITGGHVEELTVVDTENNVVDSAEVITSGKFNSDPSAYLDASVAHLATFTNSDTTYYVVGEESIKFEATNSTKGTTIVVDGNITLTDVDFGVTIKCTENSVVIANGRTVTEEGITLEPITEVEVPKMTETSKTEEVQVGIEKSEEVKAVLDATIEKILNATENNEALVDILKNHDTTVVVSIEKLDNTKTETIQKELKEKFNEMVISTVFDINVLLKDSNSNETLGNLTDLTKEIELKILLPEELQNKDRNYYVIRKHETTNGPLIEKLNATLSEDGKYLTFKTDKFSTYALAYEADTVKNTEEVPNTMDKVSSYIILSSVSLIGFATAVYYIKKKKLFN